MFSVIFIIIILILYIIFLSISGYWIVVFTRRIYLYRRYKRAAARIIADPDSDYTAAQYYYHYETEIRKYATLIMINSTEISGATCYTVQSIFKFYGSIFVGKNNNRKGLEGCAIVNSSNLIDFKLNQCSDPVLNTLSTLGDISELFVIALCISLINYLLHRMKKSKSLPGDIKVKQFLLILSIISVLLVLSSYFTFVINLWRVLFFPTITFCIIKFVIQIKRFKQALLQNAIECLAQHGSNEREMGRYRYFSYNTYFISIGFIIILIATYLSCIECGVFSLLFFENCYFQLDFFTLRLHKTEDISKVLKGFSYVNTVINAFGFVGVLIAVLPLIVITIGIWINSASKMIKFSSEIKFRYKGILSDDDSTLQESLLKQ